MKQKTSELVCITDPLQVSVSSACYSRPTLVLFHQGLGGIYVA